jgi:hypothetical protein
MLDSTNLTVVIVVSGVVLLSIIAFAYWFYRRRCAAPVPSQPTHALHTPLTPTVLTNADDRFDQLLTLLPPEYMNDNDADVDDVASHRHQFKTSKHSK